MRPACTSARPVAEPGPRPAGRCVPVAIAHACSPPAGVDAGHACVLGCCAAGKAPPPTPDRVLSGLSYMDDSDEEADYGAVELGGRGAANGANGARGTGSSANGQQQQQEAAAKLENPLALFTAWMAAAQAANIRSAMGKGQAEAEAGPKAKGKQ